MDLAEDAEMDAQVPVEDASRYVGPSLHEVVGVSNDDGIDGASKDIHMAVGAAN